MTPKLLNILLLVSSFVLYNFVFSPIYTGADSGLWTPGSNNIKALTKTRDDYTATLLEVDRIVSRAKILQKQYEGYDEDTKKKISVMVPESVNNLVLLDELTRVVNDAGPVDGLGIKDKGSGEYSVNFSVTTTYTRFKEFITYWERSMRLYNLQTVSFSPGKKDEDIIKFNIELSTYYLLDKSPSK